MRFRTIGLRLALLAPVAALGLAIGSCDRDKAPTVQDPGVETAALSPIAAIGNRHLQGRFAFRFGANVLRDLPSAGTCPCRTGLRTRWRWAAPGSTCPACETRRRSAMQASRPHSISTRRASQSGGFFRDGRAKDLAEQARHPFLDEREMANPDVASLVDRLGACSLRGRVPRPVWRRRHAGSCARIRRDGCRARRLRGRKPGLSSIRQQVRRVSCRQGPIDGTGRSRAHPVQRSRKGQLRRLSPERARQATVRRRSSRISPTTISACRAKRQSG